MTKTMKNTLLSVLALSLIALVAVSLLAVANKFLPKYVPKLDLETVKIINKICPSGVDDQKALDEKYFVMLDFKAEGIDLDKFNRDQGFNADNKVLAAYRAEKGDNAGSLIVQSQAKGYNASQPVIMMIAYSADNKVLDLAVFKQAESPQNPSNNIFNNDNFQKIRQELKGKDAISAAKIMSVAGVSSVTRSSEALANCVSISTKIVSELNSAKGGNA